MRLIDQAVRYFDTHATVPHEHAVPKVLIKAWRATNGIMAKTIIQDVKMPIARSVVEEQKGSPLTWA